MRWFRKLVTLTFNNNFKASICSNLTYGIAAFKFQCRPIKTLNTSKIRYPKATAGMLRTTKIDRPEFHALFTTELNDLIALFRKHNYELRIAGGAVRDLLMGKQSHDIDFATTATPDQMKEMFELEKVRMINTKGEGHGTITCRINDTVGPMSCPCLALFVSSQKPSFYYIMWNLKFSM